MSPDAPGDPGHDPERGRAVASSTTFDAFGWRDFRRDASSMLTLVPGRSPRGRTATDQPRRIQLRRTKGWRMPANTVKVDRATVFGNPFPVEVYGRAGAIDRFRRWLTGDLSDREMSQSVRSDRWAARNVSLAIVREWLLNNLPRLKGKHLACWCPLTDNDGNPVACHADVLLEHANRE
jgi:hypothetical protein